jgi:hypothetical protein
MVAVCRDFSLISEEEYQNYRPPQAISAFPDGLTDPLLEYSGVVENGWTAEACSFRLSRPAGTQAVEIRGEVPHAGDSDFRTEMTVLVDGVEVGRRSLSIGQFRVQFPTSATAGPRRIECRFSKTQPLPKPDHRSFSARLTFVGFAPIDEAQTRPPESVTAFPAGLEHPLLEPTGIHTDGWVSKEFKLHLTQPTTGHRAVIRGTIPQLPDGGKFQTEMTVLLDGAEVARKTLQCGEFELRVPAGSSVGARVLECRFSNDLTLPPPDGRRAVAHLKFVGFEPTRPTD